MGSHFTKLRTDKAPSLDFGQLIKRIYIYLFNTSMCWATAPDKAPAQDIHLPLILHKTKIKRINPPILRDKGYLNTAENEITRLINRELSPNWRN